MKKIGCIVSEIFNVFTFFHATNFLPGKGENWSKIFGIKDEGHWLWWCEMLIIRIFLLSITVSEIWHWHFFLEIFCIKNNNLLQEFDDQPQCDHFGEYLMVEWCQRYSTFSLFFLVTHFQPGKWRLSCVPTSIHAPHFVIDFEYLDRNPQQKSLKLDKQFARKLTTVYVFSTPLEKVENNQKFVKKR